MSGNLTEKSFSTGYYAFFYRFLSESVLFSAKMCMKNEVQCQITRSLNHDSLCSQKKVKEKSSSSYYITARIFQMKPGHEVKRTSEWKRSCKDCVLVSFGGQFGIHS